MKLLKPQDGSRRSFSPEAYGGFSVVPEDKIAALRKRMAKEMADEEWEVIEDVIEH